MNKTKILQTIFIILCVLLLGSVAYLGYTILAPNTQSDNEVIATLPNEGNQEKPNQTEDLSKIDIDLADYTVYKFDDLDFKFVIAKIRVKSTDENINVDLSHFKTNEGITLDNVSNYISTLESNGYFLGKQNVWFELVSTTSSYFAKIFIPVNDMNAKSLELTCDLGKSTTMNFDLSKISGTKDMLTYEADDVITDGKTYQMKVSKAYNITGDIITRTYEDGYSEELSYPSTAEIHAFQVDVVSVWGDELILEEATYVVENEKDYFEAFNEQFSTNKYTNLIGKTIKDKSSGVLMFMTLNSTDEPITYKGVLKLKFKGQDNCILVEVDL